MSDLCKYSGKAVNVTAKDKDFGTTHCWWCDRRLKVTVTADIIPSQTYEDDPNPPVGSAILPPHKEK